MNVKHLLSAAIGVLAGALLTWRLLDVGAGSNAQMGSNVDDSALHNELHLIHRSQAGIAEALQSIAKALSDQTLAPVAPLGGRIATEPVTPASLHELTVSLEQLRESIEAESRRTQEVIRNAPVFGGESLNELRDRTADTNWTDLEALEENWRSDPTATARSQHFQSARDLLEAYGPTERDLSTEGRTALRLSSPSRRRRGRRLVLPAPGRVCRELLRRGRARFGRIGASARPR